jgi:hypothetical protein
MRRHGLLVLCLVFSALSVSFAQISNTYYYPQVADGNGLRTTLTLTNTGTSTATITVRVTRDDGSPWPLFSELVSSGGIVTLAAQKTFQVRSSGTGPLTSGGAVTLQADKPFGAILIYSQYDGFGNLLTEAGVPSALPLRTFTIPIDQSSPFRTGVALFKPGDGNANITVSAYDSEGRSFGSRMITLPGNAHTARFVDEQDFFPPLNGSRGFMTITSDSGISAVGIRTVGASVFTTLPIITSDVIFGGNVGIGTTTPTVALDVAGRIKSQNIRSQVSATDRIMTTSRTFIDMPDMSITINVPAGTTATVLVIAKIAAINLSDFNTNGQFRLVIDGNQKVYESVLFSGISVYGNVSPVWLETLSAGTHTIKVQWMVPSGILYASYDNSSRSLLVMEF